jgi:hypothetical protein
MCIFVRKKSIKEDPTCLLRVSLQDPCSSDTSL